jgi:Flp pilus assembly protein TadG
MRALGKLLHRFEREEGGVAAVEFALILPFLLALYFGSIEAGSLYTADKRVNSISSTVGDLVAQWDPDHDGVITTTSSGTLQSYFDASTGLITPYSPVGVQIVVSLVYITKTTGATKVIWSKATGTGATAFKQGDPYPPLAIGTSPQMNALAQGGCVIASQATYSYKPLLGVVFDTALTLSHSNYFIPRYGATNVIKLDSPTVLDTSCTTGVYK